MPLILVLTKQTAFQFDINTSLLVLETLSDVCFRI
jgi:hypothetical protein